jgi:hypothetical protein
MASMITTRPMRTTCGILMTALFLAVYLEKEKEIKITETC